MAYYILSYYYDNETGTVAPASKFEVVPCKYPKRFFHIERWAKNVKPPYVNDNGQICRNTNDKERVLGVHTERFNIWKKGISND